MTIKVSINITNDNELKLIKLKNTFKIL